MPLSIGIPDWGSCCSIVLAPSTVLQQTDCAPPEQPPVDGGAPVVGGLAGGLDGALSPVPGLVVPLLADDVSGA